MNRKWLGKWFGIFGLVAAGALLFNLSSCARNQDLVSINVVPSAFTYGSAVPAGVAQTPIPLTAFGTYIHPPATKEITSQVIWASDVTGVADVDSAGNLTAGVGCGVANISATVFTDAGNKNGNVVVGFMSVTVDGPASLGCTPAGPQPILTVSFAGNGTGTVTGGISCSTPSSCSDQFPTGSTIVLTAAATGSSSSFEGWSGCSSTSGANGSVCTVLLENNLTVTATFN
jgi:hypothetical protein